VSVAAGATDCGSWWVNSYGRIEFLSLSMQCNARRGKLPVKMGGLLYVNSYGRFCLTNHVVLVWIFYSLSIPKILFSNKLFFIP